MKCYLLEGICKSAYIFSGGRNQFRPWGGTTADVGSSYEGNLPVGIAGYSLGSKVGKGLLGAASKAATRFGGPVSGLAELGYGLTAGVSKARKKGAKFGKELGRINPFLAGRL